MAAKVWAAPTTNAFQTTLNGTLAQAETTITLSSTTNLQAPGVLVIDRQDGSGNDTPVKREYISFTGISSNDITGVTRGLGGSSDQGHTSGALVESVMDVVQWNDMRDFLYAEHGTDGTHSNSEVVTVGRETYTPAASGTSTLDLSASSQHDITMPAGNITIAISNATVGQKFIVSITQDSTGSRTVTWFTTIRWAGGDAPTLTTTGNKRDVLGFVVTGAGTYDGFVVGQDI
jgi:hypothetical protein